MKRTSQSSRRSELDDGTDFDEAVSKEEQEDTRDALYGYVFHRTEADANLSRQQSASFQEARALRFADIVQCSSGWF